jgi:DNA-binding NtrC family response regulator/tetratricopeptide (TPR) repeat protein
MADPLSRLLGGGPPIVAVREQIRKLLQRPGDARRMPTVLLQGETGTGKGLVARAMHEASTRAAGPFVDVNCAAIPDTLMEAEMFGVERGAFTDARQRRPGLFQLADGGTIFLDEIGLLPEPLQSKLLKVIEERAVRRLGSTRTEPVDVWVVAATSEDLDAAMSAGRFRPDLYYRLSVVGLRLPPLRERGDDVLLLAEHFLAAACQDYGLRPRTLTPAARAALLAYAWPGNVRELSNVIERVALVSDATLITPEILALGGSAPVEARVARAAPPAPPEPAGEGERERLLQALRETGWNVTRAAVQLGVSRNTLRYRIEKYGLGAEAARPARGAAGGAPREAVATGDGARTARPALAQRERRRLTLLRAALVAPPGSEGSRPSRPALDLLVEKARSLGGRVDEVTATGIVAIFGVEPVEDAPVRAVHAAMAMRNGVERLRRDGATDARVRIAIHADHFVVVPRAGEQSVELEARPHAWAFLESLLAQAPPDGIVASEAAVPFLERRVELVPEDTPEGPPWRAWRVVGRRRTPFGGDVPMAAFVGRSHELDLLLSRLRLAATGQGQVVGITGEAGIGKSRLLHEFRRSAEASATFLEGHCLSYGSATPYLPVLEIVRALCDLADASEPEVVVQRVDAALAGAGLDVAEHAPYLLHLLGLADAAGRLGRQGPEEIKARVFDTLNELILRASERRPVVVLVEDLHWSDATSEEYLGTLAVKLALAPVLLVTTYRAGYRARWIDRSYAMQIALQPLDREPAHQVVRSILGDGDPALVEQILSRAEGNPFFLEELARAIREQQARPATLAVPDTVQEVVLARIDGLPAEDRAVLQTAAVIGKDVPLPLLRAVAGVTDTALDRSVADLESAEFLVHRSAGRRTERTFKHALIHEVAYQALPEERRCGLHAAIVTAIETLHADRLLDQAGELARHAFSGQVWDKALVYQRYAGATAAARSANSEAVVCFARALEALGHLPPGRERDEQAVDLHLLRATALVPIAELGAIVAHLREAERLARSLGDETRVGRVASFFCAYFWLIGEHRQAVEQGRRALDIAVALDDLGLRVRTNLGLAQAYHVLGDYRQAVEVLDRNLEELTGDRLTRRFGLVGVASVLSRAWLVWCLAELGEFDRALPLGEEAIRLAESVGQPYSVLAAHFGVGGLHLRRGEIARAVSVLEPALALCHTWDTQLRLWFLGVAPSLGHAYALSGRVEEAIALLEQAMERAAATNLMFAQSLRVGWLAHAYLRAARLPEARRLASQALDLARRHHERGHEAWIHGIVGTIAAREEPLDVAAAESGFHTAIAIGEALGMRPRVALGHLGLGRLYRRAGREAQAREQLATAVRLLTPLQMPLWLREADAELSLLAERVGGD